VVADDPHVVGGIWLPLERRGSGGGRTSHRERRAAGCWPSLVSLEW
jgi:hypothetical protein